MSLEKGSQLILARAQVLCANGQSTNETIDVAERPARVIGLNATVVLLR
jgi:hypothetical protein